MELTIEDYSDKSFVVRGDTKPFKDSLKAFGGRYNGNLKGGQGWIFSKTKEDVVAEFVEKVNSGEGTSLQLPQAGDGSLPTVVLPQTSVYQYVKYKVYKPKEGMSVTLKVNGQDFEGSVIKTETNDDIVDTAYLQFDDQTSMAVICRGKWTIFGYTPEHKLFFS